MFQIEAPGHFTETPRQICTQEDTVWCKARTLKDGSLVWIAAYDYDPIFDGDEGPPREQIALTTKQLTALATDPALHL
jgi:hypothetical protein